MKLPNEDALGNLDTRKPKPIREAYRSCLLLVEMIDGTIGIYDGDYHMELSTTWKPSDLRGATIDMKLTELLQNNFVGVKSVKIANL